MTRQIQFVLGSLLLVAFIGCSRKSEEQAQKQPSTPAPEAAPSPAAQPQPGAPPPSQAAQPAPAQSKPVTKQSASQGSKTTPAGAPASGATPSPAAVSTPGSEKVVAPAPPAPPRPVTAVLAAGTPIEIRLTQALSSATDKSGDKFEGTLSQDLVVDGKVLGPKGSVVVGKVSNVEGSGRVEGRARMSLALSEINVGQDSYPIRTNILSFEAESTKGRDAKVVGGTTGVGAIIGAIAGGKKGAAIGAVIGAGAGAGTVMATKGKEVEFQPEQKFSFKLESDVEMKIRH